MRTPSFRPLLTLRLSTGAACAALLLGGCALPGNPWRTAHGGSTVPVGAPLNPFRLARIDAAVQDAIDPRALPGAVVHVERGTDTYERAFGQTGYGDAAPATTATVYDVAELTTALATAPAILVLAEQGRLVLDAPLVRYFPECAGGGRDAITVRQLLTHTSGLPDRFADDPPWHGNALAHARACRQPVEAPPGSRYRYSHTGAILLGQLVERITGTPLDAFVQAHLFAPLQMRDTGFLPLRRVEAARIAPTRAGSDLRGNVLDADALRMDGVSGAAGVFTTAADAARFARMLLQGGVLDGVRVLREDSVRLLTTAQAPDGPAALRGLGMDIASPAAWRARGSLFPADSYGHTGATGCALWIDPASRTFYVLLANRAGRDQDDVPALAGKLGTLAAGAAGVAGRID